MSSITTMIWDVGGVLLTNGWDHCGREALLTHFGLDKAEFERRHTAPNDAWERGEIGVDEYLAQTVFYQPRSFTPADFLEHMKAESKVLPNGALRIAEEIAAASDLQMVILNNEARELNDYRLQAFGLTTFFSCFLSSCYLGLRKPDPKIYRRGLDILQRVPDEVVFIDDRQENVDAATALGIHGIRFKDPAQLIKDFNAVGVTVALDEQFVSTGQAIRNKHE